MTRRARAWAILAVLVACTDDKNAAKNDPDRPAVIQAPPVVLPSDTAKLDTVVATVARLEQARRELANEYAVLAAAAVLGDRAIVASFYAPDATLWLGDSTFIGKVPISGALVSLMRRSSVKEMVRASDKLTVRDSVFADSGTYDMLSQRSGGKEVDQRGTYVAEWVFGGSPKRWSMRRDRINSPAASRPR